MNLANLVSIFRIIILPIIIYFLGQETAVSSLYAFLFLSLAVVSTVADDILVRKRKEAAQGTAGGVAKVGSFLDPFADKILIIGLLFLYLLNGSFWLIPFLIFVLRDIIVAIVRWLASQDDVQIYEETYRKIMTYFYFGLLYSLLLYDLFLYLGYFHWLAFADWGIMLFTLISIILSIFSMLHHFVVYGDGLRRRRLLGKIVKKEKLIILANRLSGGYYDRYRRRLLRLFARRRKAKVHYLPKQEEMFKGIMDKVKPFSHIILAGGDGTFDGALNYLPLQKKILGFFPLGSGNAYYSYFYKGKRFEYLRSRFPFRETDIDILELAWDGGKRETTFLSLGLDAEVARLRKRKGERKGLAGYIMASFRVLKLPKSGYELACRIDGRKHLLKNCLNLTLGKVPYYGFAIRSLVGEVPPEDGNVYGLAAINTHHSYLNKAARFWGFLLTLFNFEKAPLLSLKGKSFVISSEEEFPLQAGGEFLGYTKNLEVRVKRKQKVLVI